MVQEQYLAHSIFGETLGSKAFLEISVPNSPADDRFATTKFLTTLLNFKPIPEKARLQTYAIL
jgi:hypothetical protein